MDQTEKPVTMVTSGWIAVSLTLVLLIMGSLNIYTNLTTFSDYRGESFNLTGVIVRVIVMIVSMAFLLNGIVTLQRNEARVYTFAGKYMGTLRGPGFFLVPFWWSCNSERSLAVQTIRIEQKTVNDKGGKPIIIGCDIFCHETDTSKATFDVDNLLEYLHSKGEVALRKLAMTHHMDSEASDEVCLRGSVEQVISDLQSEIAIEFAKVGYTVEKAAITALQYTPEVAGQMLQRQNAEATIAARKTIAEGAAGIVKDTIETMEKGQGITFSPQGKERLVSSLLVTLCSHSPTVPVVSVS